MVMFRAGTWTTIYFLFPFFFWFFFIRLFDSPLFPFVFFIRSYSHLFFNVLCEDSYLLCSYVFYVMVNGFLFSLLFCFIKPIRRAVELGFRGTAPGASHKFSMYWCIQNVREAWLDGDSFSETFVFFCQSGSLQDWAKLLPSFCHFSFLTSISGWTWAYGHV